MGKINGHDLSNYYINKNGDIINKKELAKLKTKIKEITSLYYIKYINNVATCLYTIIECYKGNIKLTDQEFNNYLHCLTKYNNIGPEM